MFRQNSDKVTVLCLRYRKNHHEVKEVVTSDILCSSTAAGENRGISLSQIVGFLIDALIKGSAD